MTPTPASPLYGIDTPEKDLGSVNMLEAPSIQHSDDSTFDESQPICELFPDSEPVPAPVPEEQVPAQQAVEQAEEEQEQSDDDSDDASDVKPSLTTDNIPWYTEMENCQNDINGPVNPIEWSFKDEMGEDMSEDDDVGLERSVLDCFLAFFPPNAMKNIMYVTNKKLEEDEQPEMRMGELLKFFGVLILITKFEFSNHRDPWSPNSNNQFISSLAIGMTTGMSKHWFDILLANMTFSNQPET
jgi:Transposase IS4